MKRQFAFLFALATLALAVVVSAAAAETQVPAPAATTATAAQIDAFLASKGSPMTGQGAAFIASGGRWQIDPRLIVAISGAELSFGQITCAPFNAWGYGCPNGPFEFQSWADGIDAVAQGLRTNYLAEGRTTVALINQKYAPLGAANDPTGLNNNWTINVSRFLIELGGDPNDLDQDGIAGSISLGPLGGAPVESFGFSETDDPAKPSDAGRSLEVSAGAPKPLVVRVTNTGSVAWRTQDVRLRRVDLDPHVVGAPYGALSNAETVQPNAVGQFVVQLAAAGDTGGIATTRWRLEGPSGPFGPEIDRDVRFEVPAFVAVDPRVDATAANGGIAGGPSAWNIVVHVRNAGSATWKRDGDDGVLLGLQRATGTYSAEGWINGQVAARMLEREAAPGEEASFAFRVRGEKATLVMRPFRASGWAGGDIVGVEVGSEYHYAASSDSL